MAMTMNSSRHSPGKTPRFRLACLALLAGNTAGAQSPNPYVPDVASQTWQIQQEDWQRRQWQDPRLADMQREQQDRQRLMDLFRARQSDLNTGHLLWLRILSGRHRYDGRIIHVDGTVEAMRGTSECVAKARDRLECVQHPDDSSDPAAGFAPATMRLTHEASQGLHYETREATSDGKWRDTGAIAHVRWSGTPTDWSGTAIFPTECTTPRGERCRKLTQVKITAGATSPLLDLQVKYEIVGRETGPTVRRQGR